MKTKNKAVLLLTTLITLFVRIYYSAYYKQLATYPDELRYLSIARSLMENQTLRIENLPTNYQKILYSISIIPALTVSGVSNQIRVIGVLNCVYLTIGVIPTYLLAKRYLNEEKHILIICFLYLASSNFAYSDTFMSECLFLPMGILMVYLMDLQMELFINKKLKPFLSLITGLYLFILYLCKEIALSFGITYAIFVVVYFVRERRRKASRYKYFLNALCLSTGYFLPFIILKTTIFKGLGNSYNQQDLSILNNSFNYLYYGFVYFLLMTILAYSVFPFVITISKYKALDSNAKKLFLYLITCWFVSAATISFTISAREDWGETVPRIHLRYICYLFIPLMILMVHSFETARDYGNKKRVFSISVALLAWFAYYLLFGRLVTELETVDQTELKIFSESTNQALILLIYAILTLIALIIYFKSEKIALCFIVIGLLVMNTVNESITRGIWQSKNSISEEDAIAYDALNEFVSEHPDDTFAILETYRQSSPTLNTYLYQNNVYWLRIDDFQNIVETYSGSTWNGKKLLNINSNNSYTIYKIDYLIWYDDLSNSLLSEIRSNNEEDLISIDSEYGYYIETQIENLNIFRVEDSVHIPSIQFSAEFEVLEFEGDLD